MSRRTTLCALALATALASCASVPRQDAAALARTGAEVATASAASLRALDADVGGLTERDLVRFALEACAVAGARDPTACEPHPPSDAALAAAAANGRLADVVRLRVRALDALDAAYGALGAEAAYDARGDLDRALGTLFGSVNGLTAAVATAAPAAAAAVGLAEPIVRVAADEAAERAQRRRLRRASLEIGTATAKLASALEVEAAIYAAMARGLEADRTHVVDALLEAGLADPAPLIAGFDRSLGLAPPATLPPRAAALAARTLVAYRARTAGTQASDVYRANAAALTALAAKHRAFAAGRPLDLADVRYTLDQLGAWAAALHDLPKAAP